MNVKKVNPKYQKTTTCVCCTDKQHNWVLEVDSHHYMISIDNMPTIILCEDCLIELAKVLNKELKFVLD